MKHVKRPIRIEGDVAFIPLTQGYEAVIDATDAHLVDRFNWFAKVGYQDDNTVYARRQYYENGQQREISLHRAVFGPSDDPVIDHIDGNGLNNRRSNLRPATQADNAKNRKLNANNTSGHKGVHWQKSFAKWQAYIRSDGVRRHLGFFDTSEEAAAAYAKASAELHGEFGRLA